MMSESASQPIPGRRPFPWYCAHCRRKEVRLVSMPFRCQRTHEGQSYSVELQELPVPCCGHCGEIVLASTEIEAIDRAFRAQLGLLQPEEIRVGREAKSLSPEEMAVRLGVSEAQVRAWENESVIPSRAMDNAMRALFGVETPQSVAAPAGSPGKDVPTSAEMVQR
jgi:DNA-binding transcriptional regulator YiaG